MTIQTIALIIIVGLAAGMLSGLIGVGGGIIIVPALIYILGFSQKGAQGTSLGLLMLPVGILGVINYYRNGYIDYKIVLLLAFGFLVGSFFGSKLALSMPQAMLKKIFAFILIGVALEILFVEKN